MPIKRTRTKICDRCEKAKDTLYRVRVDETQKWLFVCPACLEQVKPNIPLYQYGGTWKSKKRHEGELKGKHPSRKCDPRVLTFKDTAVGP